MRDEIVVQAEDLPLPITVIGKRQKRSRYLIIPTRNKNGAQLCAREECKSK
jgi:hypothetical protein